MTPLCFSCSKNQEDAFSIPEIKHPARSPFRNIFLQDYWFQSGLDPSGISPRDFPVRVLQFSMSYGKLPDRNHPGLTKSER